MITSALMNVMTSAAIKTGRALKRDFGEVENLVVSVKGPGDFVSAADRRAEKTLYEELSKARPGYGFLMEEGGVVEGTDPSHRWIIDPLDGTTNFLHGLPIFAISVALEREVLHQLERGGGVEQVVVAERLAVEEPRAHHARAARVRVRVTKRSVPSMRSRPRRGPRVTLKSRYHATDDGRLAQE